MSLNLDENRATYYIRAFKPGLIQINEDTFTSSLIISSDQLIPWSPKTIHDLTRESILQAVTLKPAILIIGTGEKLIFPPIELYGDVLNQHIGVEIMDTAAACRTFNALSSENRNVVAALII